jgi:hypothetical protein
MEVFKEISVPKEKEETFANEEFWFDFPWE